MERFFKLRENGTNIRTEIMAGLTTFMTMAYILVVNPGILNGWGNPAVQDIMMSWESVFLATALAAGIFTIAMGVFINFPVALAPGMGLNAYFATVVLSGDFTWQEALTAVFISGIIFVILTVTRVRQMLLVAVPDALKHAITVGIGLFITIIGLKNSGIMTIALDGAADYKAHQFTPLGPNETVIQLGSLHNHSVIIALTGIILIAVLMVLRVKGAILFGILGASLVAYFMGDVNLDTLKDASWSPNFGAMNFAEFDFEGVLTAGIVSVIVTFTFVELFDTFGTLVGTANRAGIMKNKEEGNKRVGKAMMVDAVGVSGGAVLGTSTVTAYIESSAGIAEGGRTGLTAVTTGVCFLLALFLAPIAALVPGPATAAALIVVGVLMMQSVKEIDFQDMVVAVPAFLTIVFMPFTYNIANGISAGILSYVILAGAAGLTGKSEHRVHWLMWVLAALVVVRYVFVGGE